MIKCPGSSLHNLHNLHKIIFIILWEIVDQLYIVYKLEIDQLESAFLFVFLKDNLHHTSGNQLKIVDQLYIVCQLEIDRLESAFLFVFLIALF